MQKLIKALSAESTSPVSEAASTFFSKGLPVFGGPAVLPRAIQPHISAQGKHSSSSKTILQTLTVA